MKREASRRMRRITGALAFAVSPMDRGAQVRGRLPQIPDQGTIRSPPPHRTAPDAEARLAKGGLIRRNPGRPSQGHEIVSQRLDGDPEILLHGRARLDYPPVHGLVK